MRQKVQLGRFRWLKSDTILQLSTKTEDTATKIVGRVALSSTPGLEAGRLLLQLWERRGGEWLLMSSTTGAVGDGYQDITSWNVEASAGAGSEVRMTLKVDQKGREEIVKSHKLARLYLYSADLSALP